jgi:hypothetical protein
VHPSIFLVILKKMTPKGGFLTEENKDCLLSVPVVLLPDSGNMLRQVTVTPSLPSHGQEWGHPWKKAECAFATCIHAVMKKVLTLKCVSGVL